MGLRGARLVVQRCLLRNSAHSHLATPQNVREARTALGAVDTNTFTGQEPSPWTCDTTTAVREPQTLLFNPTVFPGVDVC